MQRTICSRATWTANSSIGPFAMRSSARERNYVLSRQHARKLHVRRPKRGSPNCSTSSPRSHMICSNHLPRYRARAQLLQRFMQRSEGAMDATRLTEGLAQISNTTGRMADQLNELALATRTDAQEGLVLDVHPIGTWLPLSRRVVDDTNTRHQTHASNSNVHPTVTRVNGIESDSERVIAAYFEKPQSTVPNGGDIILRIAIQKGCRRTNMGSLSCLGSRHWSPGEENRRWSSTRSDGKQRARDGWPELELVCVRAPIVQQHGGRVEVESAIGRGSTFTVFLPLRAQSVPTPGAAVHRSKIDRRRRE